MNEEATRIHRKVKEKINSSTHYTSAVWISLQCENPKDKESTCRVSTFLHSFASTCTPIHLWADGACGRLPV